MIAILSSGYFIDTYEKVEDFLIAYASYIGGIDTKAFTILANSNEMTIEELIKYINDHCYNYDDKIVEIYELNKKIY